MARSLRTYALASGLLLTFGASVAQAKESMFLTGAELGDENSNYGFAAVVTPFDGSTLGNGWVQRYWVEGLTYQYEKTPTLDIDAAAYGGEAAVGYQQSFDSGWWAAYAGALYRHTDLSPNDPDNDIEGNAFGLKLQLEGEKELSDAVKTNAIASYTIGTESYWARGRLLFKSFDDLFVGPEAIIHGDEAYRAHQLGVVVTGFKVNDDSELGVKVGARYNEGDKYRPYVGIEFTKPFTL